jgi:hypothetical protein
MADPVGVKMVHVSATGTAVAATAGVYIKGYQGLAGGTAGDIIIRDGGASGTVRLQFNVPAGSSHVFGNIIPGAGIMFDKDVHVTLPGSSSITLFYGK